MAETSMRPSVPSGEPPILALVRRMEPEIRRALPKHITPERMLRMAITCLRKTPKLQNCDQATILGAIIELSQLGLEPSTPLGHAWIVPHKSTAQVYLGYKGLISLAARGGIIMNAEVVYEGDSFDYSLGNEPYIKHRPNEEITKRGNLRYAYSVASFNDGRNSFKLVNRAEVQRSVNSAQGKNDLDGKPKIDSEWYWRKTAVRRHSTFLPMTAELLPLGRAIELDEQAERGEEQHFNVFDEVKLDVSPQQANAVGDKLAEELERLKSTATPPSDPNQQLINGT